MIAFAALGLPAAAFAVAWPAAAAELDAPISALGGLVAVWSGSYLVTTAASGRAMDRFPLGGLLIASGVISTLALAGYMLAPGFWWLAISAGLLGVAGGLLDAGFNAFFALHGADGNDPTGRDQGQRTMNLLHTGFGVGATAGPLLLAAILALEWSWRVGMGLIAGIQMSVATVLIITRATWRLDHHSEPAERMAVTRPVWLALVVFMLATGIEIGSGQWAFSLLSEGRAVPAATAGVAAGGFWAGLTGARLLLGLAGHRVRVGAVLGIVPAVAVAGLTLLWTGRSVWVSAAGLVITGAAIGPIFPLQTLLTPERVGRRLAPTVIGYQVAAANLGGILIPGAIGLAVEARGLEAISPGLLVPAVGLVVFTVLLARATRVNPERAPPATR